MAAVKGQDIEAESRKAGFSARRKQELFEEFSGSVDRAIDAEAEKMEALDRKYEETACQMPQ